MGSTIFLSNDVWDVHSDGISGFTLRNTMVVLVYAPGENFFTSFDVFQRTQKYFGLFPHANLYNGGAHA